MKAGRVYSLKITGNLLDDVTCLLDTAGFEERLEGCGRVLIKPNLVEALDPPVTTPVGLVDKVVEYISERCGGCEVVVGDGTGSLDYDTCHVFDRLGYTEMAERQGVKLTDLNEEPLVRLSNPALSRWKEMYLPRICIESFLISLPVLKAHTLAGVTLTMKNMMGTVPPSHYQAGGHWKKSSFHNRIQESILDLNRYRTPDFTILDARAGMQEAHLYGPVCDPPPGLLLAGHDPVAVDAHGASLLKMDWRAIDHIRNADGELGAAEPLEIIQALTAG